MKVYAEIQAFCVFLIITGINAALDIVNLVENSPKARPKPAAVGGFRVKLEAIFNLFTRQY